MILNDKTFSRASIFVLGDLLLDEYQYGTVHRISPEAPVPIIQIYRTEQRLGAAANVALNASALDAQVTLMGIVGNNQAGTQAIPKLLKKYPNIDAQLLTMDHYNTITKKRIISQHQQLLRIDFDESTSYHHLRSDNQDPLLAPYQQILKKTQVVILSDYAKGIFHFQEIQSLIKAATQANIPVLVDPKSTDYRHYAGATLLTPNLKEFEAVVGPCTDEHSIEEKAKKLIDQYNFEGIVITRGSRGLSLVHQQLPPIHLKAAAKEVYDVTGAGDTLIAVMATALAAGKSLQQSIQLANLAAGLCVGKLGAAPVTINELSTALKQETTPHLRGILTQDNLIHAVNQARKLNEKIVMTNGCFDILHEGHLRYLQKAKALGDRLIVAVNSDDSVKRLKGHNRPLTTLSSRMALLAELRAVDWVVPFNEVTPEQLIHAVSPDILVKGADYLPEDIVGADFVKQRGGAVITIPLVTGLSTSTLIKKIKETCL